MFCHYNRVSAASSSIISHIVTCLCQCLVVLLVILHRLSVFISFCRDWVLRHFVTRASLIHAMSWHLQDTWPRRMTSSATTDVNRKFMYRVLNALPVWSMTSQARDRRLRPLADMSIIIMLTMTMMIVRGGWRASDDYGYVDYSLISLQWYTIAMTADTQRCQLSRPPT